MQFDVITIFPAMLDALADHGITARSLDEKRFELKAWDPRDFAQDHYRRVDDRPYGGGPGMVMMAEPLQMCIDAAKQRQRDAGVAVPKVLLMSPQGERLTEALVQELSKEERPGADRRALRGRGRAAGASAASIARSRSATT